MSNETSTTKNHHELAQELSEYAGLNYRELSKRNRTISIFSSSEGRAFQDGVSYGWVDGEAVFTLRGIYREKDGEKSLLAYDYLATINGDTVAVDMTDNSEKVLEDFKKIITSANDRDEVPMSYPRDTDGNPLKEGKLYTRRYTVTASSDDVEDGESSKSSGNLAIVTAIRGGNPTYFVDVVYTYDKTNHAFSTSDYLLPSVDQAYSYEPITSNIVKATESLLRSVDTELLFHNEQVRGMSYAKELLNGSA